MMGRFKMHKIDHPDSYEICEEDEISVSTIYTGTFHNLVKVNGMLHWRDEEELLPSENSHLDKVLTLDEIKKQLTNLYGGKTPFITVFVESPLHGEIYQYGNYGDDWWQVGELSGYA
jgi:hypothetical protein